MAERDDRRRKVTLALMACTLLTGVTAFMKSFSESPPCRLMP